MAGSATVITSLLLVSCLCCILSTDSVTIPSSCCTSFISKKIPVKLVVSYQLVNGSICPKAGVIFSTKKGHKICSDPNLPWVQMNIQHLDAKRKQLSTGSKTLRTKLSVQRHRGNSTEV